MPLYVASSGKPGKTIVAIGGTHGDEYEGPVALKNLVNTFDPNRLAGGRLIVIPVLTVSAFYADQRASAEDGINMNRAFPGKADGSISFRMARFLTDEVLSRADVVIDIHSGGRGYQIAPCMSFHAVDDPALKQQFKETAFLFGTPFTMIYTSGMGTGLLTEEAEKMGKITIGSGGLSGKGYLQGTQTMLKYLPEHHTDFIFAVLGEEQGFIGGVVVIGLFAVFLLRGLQFARDCPDMSGTLLAVGTVTILGFHIFINIAITIGLMPVTGIPLPFLSYGGNFYLTTMMGVGILLNVPVRKHLFE